MNPVYLNCIICVPFARKVFKKCDTIITHLVKVKKLYSHILVIMDLDKRKLIQY